MIQVKIFFLNKEGVTTAKPINKSFAFWDEALDYVNNKLNKEFHEREILCVEMQPF